MSLVFLPLAIPSFLEQKFALGIMVRYLNVMWLVAGVEWRVGLRRNKTLCLRSRSFGRVFAN